MPQVSTRSSPVRKKSSAPPPGFRVPPRAKPPPITELDADQLHNLQDRNARILSSPGASTSSYVQRISDEQAAIQARLIELDGLKLIDTGLQGITISGLAPMMVDAAHDKPMSRAQAAKLKAFSQAAAASQADSRGAFTFQEAMQLEQQAFVRDRERQERLAEKKQRRTFTAPNGRTLSQKEQEARILAFMNYKPTDSDQEDDDDVSDDDDDDPGTWFEGQDEDGIKGQDIVLPDEEDLSNIIRIDDSRIPYGIFYEPRDDEL